MLAIYGSQCMVELPLGRKKVCYSPPLCLCGWTGHHFCSILIMDGLADFWNESADSRKAHTPVELEGWVAVPTSQIPQGDGKFQARLQRFPQEGVWFLQPGGEPLEHFLKHSLVHAEVVPEASWIFCPKFSHQVLIMAKQWSTDDPWPHPMLSVTPSSSHNSSPHHDVDLDILGLQGHPLHQEVSFFSQIHLKIK